jgi:hypothetical protein
VLAQASESNLTSIKFLFKIKKFNFSVIADCGGLFGLFLGFSFTSLIKFIRRNIKDDDKINKVHPKIASAPRSSLMKSSSWIVDIDNKNDLNNLLIWQMQARDRAFQQKKLSHGTFYQ